MPTSSLVGLAYLNVTWAEGTGTYIDNFIPMVCEVVRTSGEDVVTDPLVRDGLEEKFGLDIPQHTVGTLIRRAHRRGFLNQEHHTFHPNHQRLSQLDFAETRDRVATLYEATVLRLVEYCQEHLDLSWDEDRADLALQDYLAEYNLEVLLAEDEHTVVSRPHDAPRSQIVVNLFIRHLQENNPGVFSHVVDLFRGAMLANALFVDDPHRVEERFGETTVFLDSPVLLSAIGYGPHERVRPQKELLELLQDLGAHVACFRPTVEEARTILETCATIMRQDGVENARDPAREMIDHFYSTGRVSTDVDRLAGRLDDKLGVAGISIEQRPDFHRDYQIDVEGLEEFIREEIGHYRQEALRHDVDVLSNIIRLRRGQPKSSLEHCGAIFVTHNIGLAGASRRFFSGEELQGTIALAVTDYHMTNVAWLKRPTAAPSLPLKRVLSDCHAAIQPSDELWQSFLGEVRRLRDQGEIDSEDYVYMRHSQEVKYAVTEVTLGDEDAITDGTVPEVLRRSRRRAQRQAQEELEQERRRRERTEEDLSARTSTDIEKLSTIAGRVSGVVGLLVQLAGYLLIGFGLYRLFPAQLPALDQAVSSYAWSAVLIALFVFLVWSRIYGKGWVDITHKIEEIVYEKVHQRLLSFWDLPQEPEEG